VISLEPVYDKESTDISHFVLPFSHPNCKPSDRDGEVLGEIVAFGDGTIGTKHIAGTREE